MINHMINRLKFLKIKENLGIKISIKVTSLSMNYKLVMIICNISSTWVTF